MRTEMYVCMVGLVYFLFHSFPTTIPIVLSLLPERWTCYLGWHINFIWEYIKWGFIDYKLRNIRRTIVLISWLLCYWIDFIKLFRLQIFHDDEYISRNSRVNLIPQFYFFCVRKGLHFLALLSFRHSVDGRNSQEKLRRRLRRIFAKNCEFTRSSLKKLFFFDKWRCFVSYLTHFNIFCSIYQFNNSFLLK